MLGFNGGLLGARRVPTVSAASGLWLPNEQSVAKRAGIWPQSIGPGYRYWKFDQFTHVSNLVEVGEFVVTVGGVPLASGQSSTTNGILTALKDGVYTARAFQMASPASSFFVLYDHGTQVDASGFRYASFYQAATRYITGVRVSVSNDGASYTVLKTFSSLTAYTANNSSTVNELSPEYLF